MSTGISYPRERLVNHHKVVLGFSRVDERLCCDNYPKSLKKFATKSEEIALNLMKVTCQKFVSFQYFKNEFA